MDRKFTVTHGELTVECTADDLIISNQDDDDVCEFVKDAEVGQTFITGGAFAECTVERVA